MASITNEQRNGLVNIIEENGRSAEFYAKFGKKATAANRAKAEAALKELTATDELMSKTGNADQAKVDALREAQRKESSALDHKHSKETAALEAACDKVRTAMRNKKQGLVDLITKLGFKIDYEYVGDDRVNILDEDTSVTQAEYSMFKKRALAGVWGAESLEEANKAIQKYLDLEK